MSVCTEVGFTNIYCVWIVIKIYLNCLHLATLFSKHIRTCYDVKTVQSFLPLFLLEAK